MIILDTNVVLRTTTKFGRGEISQSTRELVFDAQRRGEVAISAATVWEIGEQAAKGKIQVDFVALLDELKEKLMFVIPIDGNIAARAVQLRQEWAEKDPSDRFIMATALLTNSRLVTIDEAMIAWDGPVQVIDARS